MNLSFLWNKKSRNEANMSGAFRDISTQIGKRMWQLRILASTASPKNMLDLLDDHPDPPDLLLIAGSNESLRRQWEESLNARSLSDWQTQVSTQGLPMFDLSLSGPCLIIGPQHLLTHFSRSVMLEPEPPAQSEQKKFTPLEVLASQQTDLSEVPSFLEESWSSDPFVQNKQLQHEALDRIAHTLGALASKAHQQGIAMTLPEEATLPLPPWNCLMPLKHSPGPKHVATSKMQEETPADPRDTAFTELLLLQRSLTTLTFLPADSMSHDNWLQIAETMEDLGYLFMRHEHIETHDILDQGFEIGLLAATFHSWNYLHGDFCLSNVKYNPSGPAGGRAATFDSKCQAPIDHPTTASERAKDLAMLKIETPFLFWEAIKLGYRYRAPEEAEAIFQLI
jgi:hypothetical protein